MEYYAISGLTKNGPIVTATILASNPFMAYIQFSREFLNYEFMDVYHTRVSNWDNIGEAMQFTIDTLIELNNTEV